MNGRVQVGYFSAGEEAVLITKSAVNLAAKKVGLSALKPEQVADYLRPHLLPGTSYGEQARVSQGFTKNRPRGATFARTRLFPDDRPEAPCVDQAG